MCASRCDLPCRNGAVVHCSADPADAAWFVERFGGVPFDPRDRGGRGGWASWHKGKAPEKHRQRARRR